MGRKASYAKARQPGTRPRGDEGIVLPSVLMLMTVLTLVGGHSMTAALTDLRIASAHHKSVAVFHIAEAGLIHGRHEVSDEDGYRDLAAIVAPTTLFDTRGFHGGSYTVIATPVTGAVPARIRLRSSACYPAANPCPRENARASMEVVLEHDPSGATPWKRVRLVAWRALD